MPVLRVDSITVRENENVIIENLSFVINSGEQWAITGSSGSGKTTLLNALAGRHSYTGEISTTDASDGSPAPKMVLVEQQHRFKNLSNTNTFYYQQRFNSSDSEDAITVEEDLQHYTKRRRVDEASDPDEANNIVELLGLRKLLPVKLIQLSNGENKRLQIAKALLLRPTILLLDNPFTGLDVEARKTLTSRLNTISSEGIQIILVSAVHHIPEFITHVLLLHKNKQWESSDKETFFKKNAGMVHQGVFVPDMKLLESIHQLLTVAILILL